MPVRGYLRMSSNFIILLLAVFLQSALAVLSLQELQAIDAFPSGCMAAYKTVIPACPDANAFSLKSASACSKDCFTALTQASVAIQRACGGTSAPPGTVIAHAFSGDLAAVLCTVSNSEPTSSPPKSTTTIPSQPSSANTPKATTTASTLVPSKSQSSKTDSTSISVSTNSASSSSQSTLVISTSTSASSSSSTAIESSSTSSSSSASFITGAPSSSSSPEPGRTLRAGGGGSPFDQTVPNAAPTMDASQNMLSVAVGIAVAVALGG